MMITIMYDNAEKLENAMSQLPNEASISSGLLVIPLDDGTFELQIPNDWEWTEDLNKADENIPVVIEPPLGDVINNSPIGHGRIGQAIRCDAKRWTKISSWPDKFLSNIELDDSARWIIPKSGWYELSVCGAMVCAHPKDSIRIKSNRTSILDSNSGGSILYPLNKGDLISVFFYSFRGCLIKKGANFSIGYKRPR